MHEPIRARLEEYLDNPAATGREVQEHLSNCRDCEGELRRMRQQAAMVQSLRAEEAPQAGFYGRVMSRIQAEPKPSAWSLMRDAAFGWRVAVASAAVAILMAGYMASTAPVARSTAEAARVSPPKNIMALDFGSDAQMNQARNSVLVTLASFQE